MLFYIITKGTSFTHYFQNLQMTVSNYQLTHTDQIYYLLSGIMPLTAQCTALYRCHNPHCCLSNSIEVQT